MKIIFKRIENIIMIPITKIYFKIEKIIEYKYGID